MNWIRAPLAASVVLYAAFVALVLWTAPELPDRVASHFGIDGTPDGWMTRRGYLTFILIFGMALPLLITGIFSLVTVLPDSLVNLPHKDYWLAPEQRDNTRRYVIRSGLWLSCMLLVLFAVTHLQTIRANHSDPVRMTGSEVGIVLTLLLTGVGLWAFFFIRRFASTGN